MAVKTVTISPGVEITMSEFTPDEMAVFEKEYDRVTAIYSKYAKDVKGRNVITQMFDEYKGMFAQIGQACKNDIDGAGVFQGMRPTTGFGWRTIRPSDLCVAAQGYSFDVTLTGKTKDNWYGYLQNSTIGGAESTSEIYLRKEVGLGICGFIEVANSPLVEELQFWKNGTPSPVYNMLLQMRASDLKLFQMPTAEYFAPRKSFRSSMKFAATDGDVCLVPIGIAFVRADYMRNQQPTQPSTTAP